MVSKGEGTGSQLGSCNLRMSHVNCGRGNELRPIHCMFLSGFKALTTSITGILDQCAAEGKVRNTKYGLI